MAVAETSAMQGWHAISRSSVRPQTGPDDHFGVWCAGHLLDHRSALG